MDYKPTLIERVREGIFRKIPHYGLTQVWFAKIFGNDDYYCPKCGACGYTECCPARMCRGGFGCEGYYTHDERFKFFDEYGSKIGETDDTEDQD